MELVISKELLANGIQIVQNAITQKSSLPVLSNVLIEASGGEMQLTATDLDIGICATLPIDIKDEGAITVPARKFFDIIKSLPDGSEVQLSIKKNNSVNIKSGKAQFKIIGLPKEEFPQLPTFKDKDCISVDQKMFKEMLNLTDFAVSKDDTRYVLNGILLEVRGDDISVIATDGRRMAVVRKKLPKKTLVDREVIIPIKAILEVKRLLEGDGELRVQFSDTQVLFSLPGCFVISRLIEGEFPNYKKVIPEKVSSEVRVAREDFLYAARRASIFTDQDSLAIKLDIQRSKMTISKNTPYLGEAREQIDVDFSGSDSVQIGFNPRYLIDVLKNLSDEEITFEVNDATRPGVFRMGDEYTYVVLPMQLAV